MFERLLREPFKVQASVRALDEGDATGSTPVPMPPRPPHLPGLGRALPVAGVALLPSQPVLAGLPSPLLTGDHAQRSRWEVSTEG